MSVADTKIHTKKFNVKKMKCYFAHQYDLRKSAGKYRIRKLLLERDIEVVDPFIGEFKILKKHGVSEYYAKPKYEAARELWIKDLQQVRECDMIVAWFPSPSIGCSAELQEAYRHHKFIQIISPLLHPSFAYVLTGPNQQYLSIDDFERYRVYRWE